jgi:hypothetical protein
MLERLTPLGGSHIRSVPAALPRGAQPFALDPADPDEIPAAPPGEVLDALDRAARVVAELGRKGVSLSLDHDPASNRLRVKVQHLNTESGSGPAGDGSGGSELSLHNLLNLLDGDTALLAPGKD